MHRDESRTDLGIIKIHKNVIASLTAIAAMEIEGVRRVGLKGGIMELIGKRNPAINVEFDKNEEVKVELPVIIKYGFNIPDVAGRIQENVRNALEKMTNLSVKDININVQGVEKEQGGGG